MLDAGRLSERMDARRVSQSELARRIGVSQQAVSRLLSGEVRGSKHITRIARELGTTPAYLEGDTDDPDAGAPLPAIEPRIQHLMMPVALPSEAALTEMYEAQLRAFSRLQGAELARALAKRLPRALARLQGVELYEVTVDAPEEPSAVGPPAIDRREAPRAQRR